MHVMPMILKLVSIATWHKTAMQNISTKGYTHMHQQMSKREMTQLSLLVMQLMVFGQMMITELTPINLGVLTNKMMQH